MAKTYQKLKEDLAALNKLFVKQDPMAQKHRDRIKALTDLKRELDMEGRSLGLQDPYRKGYDIVYDLAMKAIAAHQKAYSSIGKKSHEKDHTEAMNIEGELKEILNKLKKN